MNEREGSAVSTIVLAFAAGLAAGAAAAYLTAPRTGRETRERLMDWASTAGQTMSRVPRAVSEAYGRGSRAAKDAFVESMREGETGSES